jgi:hypothetical protein
VSAARDGPYGRRKKLSVAVRAGISTQVISNVLSGLSATVARAMFHDLEDHRERIIYIQRADN